MSDERWNPETYKAEFGHILALYNSPGWMYLFKYVQHPPGKVLEIGCGCGKWSALFALLGFQVTCTDRDPKMLKQVRKNFPYIKMLYKTATLPFVSNQFTEQFDVVFNEGTIEHFLNNEDRVRAIEDMSRCLKSGGILILIVPYYEHTNPPNDEFKYTPQILAQDFMAAGLKDGQLWVINSPSTNQQWLGIIAKKR